MKTRSAVIAGCLAVAGWTFTPAIFADDEVREWRSESGTSIRGELIGVENGVAIIRPETQLIKAPLLKLRESDREYAAGWAKRQEKLAADRAEADLLLAKSRPLGKALIGRTVIVKGKTVVDYNLENISKVQFVLLYLAKEGVTKDADALNRLYKRLRNRYDNFEFIAIADAKSKTEADKYLIETGIQFPAVRGTSLNVEGVEPLTQLYSRGVVPQIAVIDAMGRIVSDSYRAPDPNAKKRRTKQGEWAGPKQEMKQPLDDLQKLLRVASKGGELEDKEEEEK